MEYQVFLKGEPRVGWLQRLVQKYAKEVFDNELQVLEKRMMDYYDKSQEEERKRFKDQQDHQKRMIAHAEQVEGYLKGFNEILKAKL